MLRYEWKNKRPWYNPVGLSLIFGGLGLLAVTITLTWYLLLQHDIAFKLLIISAIYTVLSVAYFPIAMRQMEKTKKK